MEAALLAFPQWTIRKHQLFDRYNSPDRRRPAPSRMRETSSKISPPRTQVNRRKRRRVKPRPGRATVGRMLEDLDKIELRKVGKSDLAALCDVGARHALTRLTASMDGRLRLSISPKASSSLQGHLRRELMRITRPCFELEKASYKLARQALGPTRAEEAALLSFLGIRPHDRLLPMLARFPVLARMWLLLMTQWQGHILEVMKRFVRDRRVLGRTFFERAIEASIADLRPGLSEPHLEGRSVVRVRIGTDWLIYKPRPGWSEWEWEKLVGW